MERSSSVKKPRAAPKAASKKSASPAGKSKPSSAAPKKSSAAKKPAAPRPVEGRAPAKPTTARAKPAARTSAPAARPAGAGLSAADQATLSKTSAGVLCDVLVDTFGKGEMSRWSKEQCTAFIRSHARGAYIVQRVRDLAIEDLGDDDDEEEEEEDDDDDSLDGFIVRD